MIDSIFKHNYLHFLFLIIFGLFAYKNTVNDWDQIAYTACILKMENNNIHHIHQKAYQIIQSSYSTHDFTEMIDKNDYRRKMYTDENFFYNELHFYFIKPLYISIIFAFNKVGLNPIEAMKWINLLSFLGIGSFIILAIKKMLNPSFLSFLVFLALISYNGLMDMLRELTPDVISMLSLIVLTYYYLKNVSLWIVLLITIVCIMLRPDNIIYCSILIFMDILFSNEGGRKQLKYLYIILLFGIHFTIKLLTKGNDFENQSILVYPVNLENINTLKTYLLELFKNFDNLISYISLLLALIWILRNETYSKEYIVFIAIFAAILIRFLFIPHLSARFYIPYGYLVVISIFFHPTWDKKILVKK